jgi:hypothetical protein
MLGLGEDGGDEEELEGGDGLVWGRGTGREAASGRGRGWIKTNQLVKLLTRHLVR